MIKLKTDMYDHQKKAYEKLRPLKVGALIMEMGTGKTRTMLEIIKDKVNAGKVDQVIWFCPCTAKVNIRKEFEKHIESGFEHFMIAGIESMSASIRLNSFLLDYVKKNRCLIVVDESSKIKTPGRKRTERIIYLGEHAKYRYILNGTPISRDERDLFSQYYFLDWRILGYKSVWSFNNNHVRYDEAIYKKVRGTINTDYLAKRIAPYSYQIKKDECLDLPKKIYESYYFTISGEQDEMYDEAAAYLIEQLDDWNPSTIYRLFSVLQAISSGFIKEIDMHGETIDLGFLSTTEDNPRLQALLDVIERLDGKIIVYCEYKKEVEVITDLLNKEYGKDSALPYYGPTPIKKRAEHIESFEKNEQVRFLVANKDCAGYSLNLQFCNQVIYYNNDWDFGTRQQSEDRIHRSGQTKKALYIDLIASDTIEERIINCLSKKESLADSFMRDVDKNKDKAFEELVLRRVNSKKKYARIEEGVLQKVGDLYEAI